MGAKIVGRTLRLSPARRFIGDLVYFAKAVPSVPVQRPMQLGPLAAARNACPSRLSWVAIFLKAYGLTARRIPELRRAYLDWPYARLYEHPESQASVAVEREIDGEPAVLFGHIRTPELKTLLELEGHVQRFKNEPVQNFGIFRRALFVSKFPRFLRRFLWWANLCWSGPMRARRFGTFGVSVYASLGAASLHPLSPLTTALNYSPIDDRGIMDVRIIYDHRVMDGATIARALALLEEVLLTEVLEEINRSVGVTPPLAATPMRYSA